MMSCPELVSGSLRSCNYIVPVNSEHITTKSLFQASSCNSITIRQSSVSQLIDNSKYTQCIRVTQKVQHSTLNHSFSPDVINKRDTSFLPDTSYHHLWKRATIWSACIPGAGQIYNEIGYRKVQNKHNRAWWKVPIIYGALGTTGYLFYTNLITAQALKTEWLYRTENPGMISNTDYQTWDNDDLLRGIIVPKLNKDGQQLYNNKGEALYTTLPGFDLAAKRRDLLAFGFLAIWGLQTIEALVDGHFVTFDVSEDLSFTWSPVMMNYSTPGVSLKLEIQ